jgi:hypothetical protein
MLRIWLIAMLAAAVVGVSRDHDLLHRTSLIGSCTTTHAPAGQHGEWRSCRKGVLDGRPDLSRQSCRSQGRDGSREYWRCPASTATASSIH